MTALTIDRLLQENADLRRRLEEAEDALHALRAGEVDAILVESEREQVYTLETSETPYRLLVAQVPHAAVTLTADGAIISCNRRFADLLQMPSASLSGRPIRDFVAPDSHATFEALLRDGSTIEAQDTVTLLRADGTPTSACLGVRALREGALGQCLMVTDLTEHRHYEELQRAQASLRASEAGLRAILDNMPAVVYLVDDRQRFTFINRHWKTVFNLTSEQAVGRPVADFFPRDVADRFVAVNREVLRTGKAMECEEVVPQADGPHTYISSKVPLLDSSGAAYALCGISVDITERKRAEQALREADRQKDEFLATLAHELRSPLAPIRNAVQILHAKGPPLPELQWARDVIDRQVQVMSRLLEDLLDISRISRNNLELRTQRVDLAAVVEAAVETSRPVIEAGGHALAVTLPPERIRLEADPVRVAQVFANLLNNAAKYTEEGGCIRLSAERQGSAVIVSVKDNGIGIATEMLPRVFEIFSQAKPGLVRSQGGLGIGLSLVRRLVEMHGGCIEARSGGPGQGSEFVVRLPIAAESPLGEPARPIEDDEQQPVTKCRVLIVDDNRDSADSLAKLLTIMGHEVGTAYDGEQAVEAAGTLRPQVALLDIGMPKLDGYEACRRIRKQPWGQEMFLISLTGWGQEEDFRRAEEAGFNHHIVKPVDPALLMKLLASLPSQGGQLTKR